MRSSSDALGDATSMATTRSARRRGDRCAGYTQTTYDADGRLLAGTDPLGNTTSYGYDALGRTLAVTDPMGYVTGASTMPPDDCYQHDALGNTVLVTDGRGLVSSTSYDATNQPLLTTSSDGSFVQRSNDAAGQQTTLDTANTQVTWAYDGAGRTTDLLETAGGLGAAPLASRNGGTQSSGLRLPTFPQQRSSVSSQAGTATMAPWSDTVSPVSGIQSGATNTTTPFAGISTGSSATPLNPTSGQSGSGANPPGWAPFATASTTSTPPGGLVSFPSATNTTGTVAFPTGSGSAITAASAQGPFPTAAYRTGSSTLRTDMVDAVVPPGRAVRRATRVGCGPVPPGTSGATGQPGMAGATQARGQAAALANVGPSA